MGVLERGDRDKDNKIGLKEGGGIEMSIYSASIYAMLAPSLKYSPAISLILFNICSPVINSFLVNDVAGHFVAPGRSLGNWWLRLRVKARAVYLKPWINPPAPRL